MYCPYCGRDIPNRTTICPACHGLVSEAMMASYYREQEQAQAEARRYSRATAEQQINQEPKRRKWPIVVALLVVLAIVAAIAVPLLQEAASSNRTDHRVTFLLKTPGYNDEATAIPVQITGTKTDGTAYEEMVFLDGGGNGVSLDPGTYTLTFPGGTILANGTVLKAPKKATLEVEVPEGLARNEFVQVPTSQSISYQAIAPLDLTDKTLDAVYDYAIQDPDDAGKADTLRAAAVKAREDAVAKKEADTAAIEKEASGKLKVSLGDEVKFVGTLEINTAEDVAARLGNDNIVWNMGGQRLAVLWLDKPRKVTIETNSSTDYYNYYYYDDDNGRTYTDTQEYEVSCLVFSTDVDGIYSMGDDGTLSSHDGKRVLASGHITMPGDWNSSLVSPIALSDPQLENL